jgi:hypothetical protein
MARNHQVGTALLTRRPPTLVSLYRGSDTIDITGTRVRGGSWTEDDVTQSEKEMDEVEEAFNVTTWNEGDQTKCDLFPVAGFEPKVGDVLEESSASAALAVAAGIDIFEAGDKRRWVVESPINRKQFGKRALIFSLTLYRGPALDTTQIEEDT